MGLDLLRRIRWGNVGRLAGAAALVAAVVAWPRLAPPEPALPERAARPLDGLGAAPAATPPPELLLPRPPGTYAGGPAAGRGGRMPRRGVRRLRKCGRVTVGEARSGVVHGGRALVATPDPVPRVRRRRRVPPSNRRQREGGAGETRRRPARRVEAIPRRRSSGSSAGDAGLAVHGLQLRLVGR